MVVNNWTGSVWCSELYTIVIPSSLSRECSSFRMELECRKGEGLGRSTEKIKGLSGHKDSKDKIVHVCVQLCYAVIVQCTISHKNRQNCVCTTFIKFSILPS